MQADAFSAIVLAKNCITLAESDQGDGKERRCSVFGDPSHAKLLPKNGLWQSSFSSLGGVLICYSCTVEAREVCGYPHASRISGSHAYSFGLGTLCSNIRSIFFISRKSLLGCV
jgi:hypothetical protein